LGGGGGIANSREGAKANAIKNNYNESCCFFHFLIPPFGWDFPTKIENLSKDIILTFLSSIPRLRDDVLR